MAMSKESIIKALSSTPNTVGDPFQQNAMSAYAANNAPAPSPDLSNLLLNTLNPNSSGTQSSDLPDFLQSLEGNRSSAYDPSTMPFDAAGIPAGISATPGALNTIGVSTPPDNSTDPTGATKSNPTKDLVNSLISRVVGGSTDPSATLQASLSAANAAGAPYSAEIGSLRHQNNAAKNDTKASSKHVRQMYQKLSNSYNNDAKRESQQSAQSAALLNNNTKQAASTVNNAIQNQLTANAAQGQALGSSDLTNNLNTQLTDTAAQNTGAIAQTGQTAANDAVGRGNIQNQFSRNSAKGARLEGTNQRADLQSQLLGYLQGNRNNIADLKGQQAGAVASARQSALQSYATAVDSQNNDQISNLLSTVGAIQGISNDKAQNKLGQENLSLQQQKLLSTLNPDTSSTGGLPASVYKALQTANPSGAANLLLTNYVNQLDPSGAANAALDKALQNPSVAQGYITDSNGNKVALKDNTNSAGVLLSQAGLSGSTNPLLRSLVQSVLADSVPNTTLPYGVS
jgi:hypothetical protein